MAGMRAIPRRLLPDTMDVREPAADGSFGEAKTIAHVRFERKREASADAHRSESLCGRVFVDAVTSTGAYEVPAGSRIEIQGLSLFVESCTAYEGANGRVHHWELDVR
ncbi:MAG: minor capsid protein [Eggerthellaceae bacterium]|nr:minor capsid protein [Eggerthellaceae bacterium]